MKKPYNNYPDRSGKINIFPRIDDGRFADVVIIGDPEGLRYLAKLLNWLADSDQNQNDDPIGARFHTHLHFNEQLGEHSCEVELCRADAKGTGEYPDFM